MKSDLRLTNVDSTCSFDNIGLFWSTFRFAQGTIVLVLQNLGQNVKYTVCMSSIPWSRLVSILRRDSELNLVKTTFNLVQ